VPRTRRKNKKKPAPARRRTSATSASKEAAIGRTQPADPREHLSRAALLKKYPCLPVEFPLLFHALQPDMTIDDAAAPKIGTIPNSVTPAQKCEVLRDFYGRGKRVIRQLDEFTQLVKPRTNSNRDVEPLWPEINKVYTQALIQVRRKVVERTENYKYTRRDNLRK
jgi:hypothetical protein